MALCAHTRSVIGADRRPFDKIAEQSDKGLVFNEDDERSIRLSCSCRGNCIGAHDQKSDLVRAVKLILLENVRRICKQKAPHALLVARPT